MKIKKLLSNEVSISYISPLVFTKRFFAWPVCGLTLLTICPQKQNEQLKRGGQQVSESYALVVAKTAIHLNYFEETNP